MDHGGPALLPPGDRLRPLRADPAARLLPSLSGRCSITAGYVYRGAAVPDLVGTHLSGDFCSGEIFGLRRRELSLLLDTELRISSFGEDEEGEVYVVDLDGAVYRIVGADPS